MPSLTANFERCRAEAFYNGVGHSESLSLVRFIEENLPTWIAEDRPRYYKKNSKPSVVCAIEYDNLLQQVFVHLKKKKVLGDGLFAIVTLSLIAQTGQKLALKTLRKVPLVTLDPQDLAHMHKEGERHLLLIDCPNIVKVHRVIGRRLLLEHIEHGTLDAYLQANSYLSPQLKTKIARGCIAGMLQMHQKGLVHRDIKSDNVLIASGFVVKLGDLGTAATIGEWSHARSGCPCARSPLKWQHWINNELHQNQPEDDLWAMGMLLYELEYGHEHYPFFADALENLYLGCVARDQHQKSTQEVQALYDTFIAQVQAFHAAFNPRPNSLNARIMGLLSLDPERRLQALQEWRS